MYPVIRLFKKVVLSKNKHIKPLERDTLKLRCYLPDIDIFMEMNNGRYLTLMDLGRMSIAKHTGLIPLLKKKKWSLMVAGNFTRYRRRIRYLQRFELHSQIIGYDERWFYFYQEINRGEVQHASALIRTAVVSAEGIVPSKSVMEALNIPYAPFVPEWVIQWVDLHKISPVIK